MYRVEYNGSDMEAATLDSAIEGAKQAIAADIGPVSGWTVEHDDTINDWFIQGVADGVPIGPTAVVSGPEPTMTADPPGRPADNGAPVGGGLYRSGQSVGSADGGWVRAISFTGVTPAEVFAKATSWLTTHPDTVEVSDVGWQNSPEGPDTCRLLVHYRGAH